MLQVGSASLDITPGLGCHLVGYFTDRVATEIHDPLHAKALAVSNGDTTVGVVICDLIVVPAEVVLAAKERIAAEVGVPAEQVMICGTHTHTGPSIRGALGAPETEGYAEWVAPRIADAFIMACRRLRPAQVAFTRGDCAGEVHNRRRVMKDGSVRMNPGYRNPDVVGPAGPTDPELGILIFRSPQREPLGVLANLALHYVGVGVGEAICADYFAEFGVAMQRIAGAPLLAILANGCQGDINNCDFDNPPRTSPDPYFQIRRVANVVAAEAWKVWSGLREEDFRDDVPLGGRLEMVPFKARVPSPEELAQAKARFSAGGDFSDTEWAYARELVLMESAPSEWIVPISALRIGDLGLAGLPGEVFCQVGLDIKAGSPFGQTMVLGLANGSVGYVATDKAMDEGSYETRLCRHVRAPKGTHSLWLETATRLLNELKG